MAWSIPWNLIGIEVSGDIGGLTIYTNRFGKKVAYPKSPPKKSPSPRQIVARDNFRTAQAAWSILQAEEKTNLEDATKKLSAPLTGQNLFVSAVIRQSNNDLVTFENQSGINLPRIPT